ncbi:MAG TPA: methylated-DNA--[protein]-cysteine S-methyltransferase [Thermoanaerobaculia bacterium]|nr:methylated-DNA--[protein]-cysteine S-methyltransferase [Thermoanaerobaculia bacterium]
MTLYTTLPSPVGPLLLAREGAAITQISFGGEPRDEWRRDDDAFADAIGQLREYFDGKRKVFDLELAPRGTEFQRAVWTALTAIPYGELRSYRDIAIRIGKPEAVRAVGAANGANPLPIVVPCHRVVGSNGSLTGFGGGLTAKQYLIDLERAPRLF